MSAIPGSSSGFICYLSLTIQNESMFHYGSSYFFGISVSKILRSLCPVAVIILLLTEPIPPMTSLVNFGQAIPFLTNALI